MLNRIGITKIPINRSRQTCCRSNHQIAMCSYHRRVVSVHHDKDQIKVPLQINEINRCTQIAGTMQCEDPEVENSTGDDCEKIGIGVLGLAPCHFSEKRKTDGRYVILASQIDFTLLNRRLRWPESC